MKNYIVLFLIFLLVGCASSVPSTCPKVQVPIEPHYAIQDLTAQSSRADVSKAWVASFYQCHASRDQLAQILEGFN